MTFFAWLVAQVDKRDREDVVWDLAALARADGLEDQETTHLDTCAEILLGIPARVVGNRQRRQRPRCRCGSLLAGRIPDLTRAVRKARAEYRLYLYGQGIAC